MSSPLKRILFIICDDLAWGDLSCHGNPHVRTPRIDSLSEDGASCGRHLSGPLCTPARAALMTGRHPYRTRAVDTYLGRSILDPGERTVAQGLADAGWQCALFGKWHLVDTVPSRPHDLGFHEALYHTGGGLRQPANRGANAYFDPVLQHNGEPVASQGYCADIFTEAAIDFIRKAKDEPWFCYLAFNTPHTPMEVGEEWVAPLRRSGLPEAWAQLYGMVANIDYNVGRLLEVLDRQGLREDTLVVFTSDHGPCPSINHDGKIRYNAGLRGNKGTMYEGGLRVPCFFRWPARIPAGGYLDAPTNPIDILPTLASATGAVMGDRIDGMDMMSALTAGDEMSFQERTLCLQWHRGNVPQAYRNAVAINSRWKWYRPELDQPDELYDVALDPGEKSNLALKHPTKVDELRTIYEAWFEDVSATRGDSMAQNYAPVRIPVGDPREPAPWLTRQDWRRADGAEEGWSDDQPGDWFLEIRQSGDYALTVEFTPSPSEERELLVRCGDCEKRQTVPPRAGKIGLEGLSLSAGECTLVVRLSNPEGSRLCGVNFARLKLNKTSG